MMKYLRYALLAGIALSVSVGATAASRNGGGAFSWATNATGTQTGLYNIGKAMQLLGEISATGIPVLDITSVPAHAVVAVEQEFIRMRTEMEHEVKKQIKERISVKYDPRSGKGIGGGSGLGKDGFGSDASKAGKKQNRREVDAKLSRIEIKADEAIDPVAEGIAGKGVKLANGKTEIELEGETTTYELALNQQANWTSAAGSVESREAYENRRRYIEQEQAIRMLAAASVLRSNVQNTLTNGDSPVDKSNATYDDSDAKKDLSSKGGKVENTNDYNQTLRQYAYHGLVYDQLLSLEQQVVGLRLQAKAGKQTQSMSPLTDKLTINGQADPTKTDEANKDKKTGTGTRK